MLHHLLINRTTLYVRPRQIPCAHEKFVYNFTSGKLKGFFEELGPLLACFWVMAIEPTLK